MAEPKKEGLDLLTRLRIRELILMGLLLIAAVMANLPEEYIEHLWAWTAEPWSRASASR